ncbi:MAG: NADAR family protein [Saprospiraceae bacterium]|nr:NADAR family protein [Candidatus Brachybacter algidus]
MKYNIEQLITKGGTDKRKKFIFFWGNQPDKSGQISASCFSQWWLSRFEEEGLFYSSSEQYMMAKKALLFEDMEIFHRIMEANSPAEAKDLGRKIRNFDENVWNEHRYDIVVKGNLLKFSQNEAIGRFLKNTNERILVEASPVDRIWGIGLAANDERVNDPEQWQGLNLLGFALMEVRDMLFNQIK